MIEGDDLEMFRSSVAVATSRHTGAELDIALNELGWPDALAADPLTAIATLFPLQGQANATSSALSRVVLNGLAAPALPVTHVVLPALGRWSPPGVGPGDRLTVAGLGPASLKDAEGDVAVVVSPTGSQQRPVVVLVEATALSVELVAGMDPAMGLARVSGDGLTHRPTAEEVSWPAAVALAQVALGFELVGAARAMLALARQHALDRIQFGQPIGRFQAVRHRLAETLVAIEAAEAVLLATCEPDESERSGGPHPELAAMGKALAGRGARTAARHCQQVLAGIGFTAEHPFHHHLRRVLVLDQLFGTSRSLTEDLGRDLLASRRMPDLLPL